MHCYIKLFIFNERFEFRIKKLTRKYLYGHKEIVAKNGDEECEKAYLNENGMIHLTNGCTKFFSTEVKDAAELINWNVDSKSVDYQFTHSLGSSEFVINKNGFFENADKYLERKIIASYELTSGDKNQMEIVKGMLKSKIWTGNFKENCKFCLFANDDGLFASVYEPIASCCMYEDTVVSMEEDTELFDEDSEIDFENLW